MRGTLISIFVGTLAGVLLTVGTSVHASRAAANRATQAGSGIANPSSAAAGVASTPAERPTASDEQAPLAK